jgi:type I restriction enzyme S subunit
MNKIEQMIAELCPNGVEFKKLGELGEFENIGVDKKIVEGQKPVLLLNYMDVYRNRYITHDILTMEVTASDSKIRSCTIEEGDLFITPSSETRDDIGHTTVATATIPDAVYSYHIMRFRLNTKNMTTAYYINYLFESEALQSQICKAATGLTRFGLSKSKFANLIIPVPPLAIQQEIVNILDKFTALEAELEAELEARRKQYEHYRSKLLTFNDINGCGV